MVKKSPPLRSCVGLSILATSYCAYSDPFPTGLLKYPYSFLLGQCNRLNCTNPPPHRENQRPKCTNPPPLWEGNAKNELTPHPWARQRVKDPKKPHPYPMFPGRVGSLQWQVHHSATRLTVATQQTFTFGNYRIYSNKRRGAYVIFCATGAALIRGRRLFKHYTRQIYFFNGTLSIC